MWGNAGIFLAAAQLVLMLFRAGPANVLYYSDSLLGRLHQKGFLARIADHTCSEATSNLANSTVLSAEKTVLLST
jgi:hypothetical protein